MSTPESQLRVRGLVPILATPFDATGALDVPGLRRLVEFQLAAGADGVAVFGLASEGFALTAAERATILAETRAVAGPEVPLVAGVNATSTSTSIEQALAARDGGADALMVLPPYLVKPAGGQVVDFYGTVAERSGLHVMVQDAPASTGVSMPVPLIVELSKLTGVESVKVESQPTAPKVGDVVTATDGEFDVLGGQNAFFVLEEYARGAVGTMPACEFTDLLAPILADWRAGHHRSAHEAFTRLLPLVRFGLQQGLAWAVHKEVLVRRGIIDCAFVRDPAAALDAGSRAALDSILSLTPLPSWRT
ncbi:dihydrodipicolinate synthase family protein [Micromonospora sp. NPDC047740]|uniref:dihydrodipicolinate synthase family protein n=1 Tax=Micromonospora sp. NPDC047740 TaxID=3364254 RepID=UPI003711F51A